MANYFHILIIVCEQAIFRKAEITLMFVVMCMNSGYHINWGTHHTPPVPLSFS